MQKNDSANENRITVAIETVPPRSPHVQRVIEACISHTAEYARRRCGQNMSFPSPGFDRLKHLEKTLKTLDKKELRDMIIGDLQCIGVEGWGPNASGVGVFFEKYLGIHVVVPRTSLQIVNLDSKTLAEDVLSLAKGAHQDLGFFIQEETPEGKRSVGVDELALQALQKKLKPKGD